MTTLKIFFLAFIQGITEPFPVSSLGHAVLIPSFFDWRYNPQDPIFLPLLVFLHAGTSLAFLCYFSKDWIMLALGALGYYSPKIRQQSYHLIGLLCITTIPAVFVGYFFENEIRSLFSSELSVSFFLFLNGVLLLAVEKMRQQHKTQGETCLAHLTYKKSFFVGLCQCLAFFPGMSRSGATIGGGLLCGMQHETSALFSFLIAQPIIFAATIREMTKIHFSLHASFPVSTAVCAAVIAGVTALSATAFLMRYFKNHEQWALSPFGWYCMGLGCIGMLVYM